MTTDPFPSETDRSVCEAALRRFEDAWRQPSRPDLSAFVPPGAVYRARLLLELAHVDLELRLRAGETARVEDYPGRFPELADDEALLALLTTEIEFRLRHGEAPSLDEYRRRFPHLADRLKTPPPGRTVPLAAPTEPRAGPLPIELPGYEMLGEVGRGGMGVVYLARQTALKRTVALKTLDPAAGPELLARFRREAEAMARLDHPHIVPVYEVGSLPAAAGAAPYFTMQWYPGGSLDRRPGGPGSDPAVQAGVVETIARAVHHAHQRGVLHRDLKPSNVLLDENGEPHVGDFGLAGLLDSADAGVHTAGPLGTPAYMAPEQARAPRAVTTAADIYGLGALLYHLLAGRPPFQAETALATLVLAAEQAAPPPSTHHPAVPRDLDVITLKCLEKDPARRYPSAEALADDLARWRRGEPITARPAGVGERARRWAVRHPALAGMALLTALALLTTLVTLLLGNAAIRRREEQTRDALRREQRRLYLERIASAGRLYSLNRLRQAWQLLDACAAEHRGWEWRYLDGLRRSVPAPLTEHADRVSGVAHLADGRLVTADASGELRLWDGDRLVRRQRLSAVVTTLAAHPTLPRVATTDGRTVTVWDVSDGTALARTPGSGWVAFSPDGSALAVADGPAVQLLDARLQTGQRLTGHAGRVLGGAFAPGQRLLTAAADGSIRVWDLSSAQTVASWRHALEVSSLTLLDRGRTLALAHAAGVALTDPLTGRLIASVGAAEATRVAAAPRRGLLALADRAGEVVVWDAARRTMRIYRGHDGTVSALAFSGDERFLVSGGIDRTARRWDLQREADARGLLDSGDGANGLAVSADGRNVAVAPRPLGKAGAGVVRLLDTTTGEERLRLPGGGDVAFDPTGRRMAYARGSVVLIHDMDGQPTADLGSGAAPVTRLAFSADGAWLAAGDLAGVVRLFDRRRGNVGVEAGRLGEAVYALVFSADGNRLLAAGGTRALAWQLPGWTALALPAIGGARALACSADGKWWATADRDRVVRLRDAATGEVVRSLPENPLPTEALAFSPDGSRLASGGEDGVRLWDVASGQLLLTLPAGTAPVRAIAWDATHDRLFVLSDRLRIRETRHE